ncbi:DUF4386 domain-containing protein [Kitasatospora sp. NPDC088134]|uniref:DUF4386 domain-containing protein n=1 Tax=Kitasatospora sp. NPDC088134 TaxID=3364071 RepID=UPI00380ED6D0
MDSTVGRRTDRGTAVVAGVLFLVTEVAAIAGMLLYRPALDGAAYVAGPGVDGHVAAGALCEVVLVLAVIGTGVVLYPVLRRHQEAVALGYVCGRLLEAAVITVGIVGMLAVVTLRRDAGAEAATAARALVAVHDWTFLLGPNVVLGANSLALAFLMHRSRLVPRPVALLGLVGGALILASAVAVLFGVYPQVSTAGSLAALPVFAWEVTLAVRLLVKGFAPARPDGRPGEPTTATAPSLTG